MSSRAYCFTYYGENMPQYDESKMKYLVFQKEKCPETGREHFQGFVRFNKNLTFKQAQEALHTPDCHMERPGQERADGSTSSKVDEDNRDYCTKEASRIDGPWEYGTCGKRQGERTDIAAALEVAKTHGLKRACEEQGATMVKYHKGIEYVLRKLSTPDYKDEFENWVPRAWQARVIERLKAGETHDRKIWYFFDANGSQGKSTLSRYLVSRMGACVFDITNGKDVAYAWNGEPIVVFDLARAMTRDTSSGVNWAVIEKVKDGFIFSGKYESTMKKFNKPFVLVFANHLPPEDTYSKDRLFVITMPEANFPILP